jgi:hypothetical protein
MDYFPVVVCRSFQTCVDPSHNQSKSLSPSMVGGVLRHLYIHYCWLVVHQHCRGIIVPMETRTTATMTTPRPPSSSSSSSSLPPEGVVLSHHPVVIVGAGVAGLSCAGKLAATANYHHRDNNVLILEANDRVGGRVWGRRGAELMHGTQTALTQYLGLDDDHANDGTHGGPPPPLRPIYIVSHADGGPSIDDDDKKDAVLGGRYGQWYMDGTLYRAHEHPDIMELRHVLDEYAASRGSSSAGTPDDDAAAAAASAAVSILDIIPLHLHKLAAASFGNTAGCTDLRQVSADMLLHHFGDHWDATEEHGDHFLDADLIGMLVQDLEPPSSSSTTTTASASASVQLKLRHKVLSITPLKHDDEDSPLVLDVMVSTNTVTTAGDGLEQQQHRQQILADAVVITVPPHHWPTLLPSSLLSNETLQAIQYVGMERPAVKIVCRYHHQSGAARGCWDPLLQQIVCLDEPIPEIWFDGTTAVGFIMSGFAVQLLSSLGIVVQDQDEDLDDDDATSCADNQEKKEKEQELAMVQILTTQLAKILQVPIDQLVPEEYSCTIWRDGAYMYPKVQHLQTLAARSVCRRVHFAGEATHTGACCTIQAAMETGYRAADDILALSSSLSPESPLPSL